MSLVACLEKSLVVHSPGGLICSGRGCVRFSWRHFSCFRAGSKGPDSWLLGNNIEKYAKPCKTMLKKTLKTASSKSGVFWNRQGPLWCSYSLNLPMSWPKIFKDDSCFPGFSMPFQSEKLQPQKATGLGDEWWRTLSIAICPIANINLEGKKQRASEAWDQIAKTASAKRFTPFSPKQIAWKKINSKKCLRISERSIQWVMMPGELVTQPQLVAFNCHARRQVNLKPWTRTLKWLKHILAPKTIQLGPARPYNWIVLTWHCLGRIEAFGHRGQIKPKLEACNGQQWQLISAVPLNPHEVTDNVEKPRSLCKIYFSSETCRISSPKTFLDNCSQPSGDFGLPKFSDQSEQSNPNVQKQLWQSESAHLGLSVAPRGHVCPMLCLHEIAPSQQQ